MQWLRLTAWKVGGCGFEPRSGLQVSFLLSSASDREGSNFKSCVWRAVSSHSSHHPYKVLLAKFSLSVHKGGLKNPRLIHSPKAMQICGLWSICHVQVKYHTALYVGDQ